MRWVEEEQEETLEMWRKRRRGRDREGRNCEYKTKLIQIFLENSCDAIKQRWS